MKTMQLAAATVAFGLAASLALAYDPEFTDEMPFFFRDASTSRSGARLPSPTRH